MCRYLIATVSGFTDRLFMAEKFYPCPHCGHLINVGAYFAAMAKGVPRKFTAKERERRALRLAKVRKRRWPVNDSKNRIGSPAPAAVP